jgi:hypothetical protein
MMRRWLHHADRCIVCRDLAGDEDHHSRVRARIVPDIF